MNDEKVKGFVDLVFGKVSVALRGHMDELVNEVFDDEVDAYVQQAAEETGENLYEIDFEQYGDLVFGRIQELVHKKLIKTE